MSTLQLSSINLSFGDRDLLKDVSMTVDSGTRAALAGGNGEGKSTLLKIACSVMEPDSGNISMTRGLFLSYLPQSDIVLGTDTVYQEIEKGFDRYKAKADRQQELARQMSAAPLSEALALEYQNLQEQLEETGYYLRAKKIGIIASGLGFSTSDLERPCSTFSGGYQMRIALARTLAAAPDILLLDEPTNYLDIDARVWLKNYILSYSGGVVIVCHDRSFLDQTVNEVYELCRGKLTRYKGTYTDYERQRREQIQQLEEAWKKQQAEIEHNQAFIERFRYKATKSKQVQSRIKMLERMEPIFVPTHLKKLSFSFPEPPHSPNDMVVIRDLHKSYGENVVYDGFDLIVNKGDRLAVAGQNGKGKSTLLRIIARSDTAYSGTVNWGPNVSIGYFAQDNQDSLNPKNTVLEEVSQVASTSQLPALRNILGNFLFSGDDIFKPVSVLSGGEKSRLALLKILLHPVSLLILDEPTNHLDLNAQDMLLEALKQYRGTLVFVSHDSYFISRLATRILYLSDERPQIFEGDYEYFSWKLEQKDAYAAELIGKKTETAQRAGVPADRKEANRIRNQKQKIKRQTDELLEQMEIIKSQIRDLDEEISKPENYSNPGRITALVNSRESLKNSLEAKEEQWLEMAGLLEGQEE